MNYEWQAGMGEISGFGGGYEEACRSMYRAGMTWLDEHPSADPKFRESPQIFGIVDESNDDAKALSKAIEDSEPGCTGAMHHAVVSCVMYTKRHGWDAFVKRMKHANE
jgi:hypothetical protein